MRNKTTYWNYKEIQKESHRIDCTITEEDFNTNRPNSCRINALISDMNRHLKYEEVTNND